MKIDATVLVISDTVLRLPGPSVPEPSLHMVQEVSYSPVPGTSVPGPTLSGPSDP